MSKSFQNHRLTKIITDHQIWSKSCPIWAGFSLIWWCDDDSKSIKSGPNRSKIIVSPKSSRITKSFQNHQNHDFQNHRLTKISLPVERHFCDPGRLNLVRKCSFFQIPARYGPNLVQSELDWYSLLWISKLVRKCSFFQNHPNPAGSNLVQIWWSGTSQFGPNLKFLHATDQNHRRFPKSRYPKSLSR